MKLLWKLILLASVLAGVTVAFIPDRSFACSCVSPLSVQESLEGASVVFAGEVAEVREARHKYPYYRNIVEFKTDKVFKGEAGDRIAVWTGGGGGDCGFHFAKGESYLVYAYGSAADGTEDADLNTGICTRTGLLTQAGGDLAELGEGAPPNPASRQHIVYWEEEDEDLGATVRYPYAGPIATVAVIAAGVAFWLIRRKYRGGKSS